VSKPNGFFHDSTGARSYGRLASFLLVLGGILLGVAGRDYGAMLTAAAAFYATSKANQAYVEGKALEPTGKINPA